MSQVNKNDTYAIPVATFYCYISVSPENIEIPKGFLMLTGGYGNVRGTSMGVISAPTLLTRRISLLIPYYKNILSGTSFNTNNIYANIINANTWKKCIWVIIN